MLEQIFSGNVPTCIVATFVLLLLVLFPRRRKGVPHGPFVFPVFGNLPALMGRDVMGRFGELRQKYGDVYGLYFGQDLTVILNGYDVIHDALVKKGNLFSVRPQTEFHRLMFKTTAVVFANGQLWREQRQFSLMALNEFGYNWTSKSLEERINDEISHFIDRVESFKAPFNIRESVNLSVANVVAGILFGERCSYDDPKFRACLDGVASAARLFARSNILMSCFPFLRHLPGDILGIDKIEAIREHPKRFIQAPLQQHLDTYEESAARDVTDLYIKEIRDNEANGKANSYTMEKLKSLMGELLSAGTETTATCIIWIIVYLIRNPAIQKRLREDIYDVIGKDRTPSLEDRPKLPNVEATILEVLRIEPVAPLSVPHAVHEDVVYRGLLIPKDTTVLVNLHSVLKDPTVWPEPDLFKPERFLGENGAVKVPKEFIPFSVGRRSCLGESLARMELFLYTTALLQKFELASPEGAPLPSLAGHLDMTYSPRPFDMVLRPVGGL